MDLVNRHQKTTRRFRISLCTTIFHRHFALQGEQLAEYLSSFLLSDYLFKDCQRRSSCGSWLPYKWSSMVWSSSSFLSNALDMHLQFGIIQGNQSAGIFESRSTMDIFKEVRSSFVRMRNWSVLSWRMCNSFQCHDRPLPRCLLNLHFLELEP